MEAKVKIKTLRIKPSKKLTNLTRYVFKKLKMFKCRCSSMPLKLKQKKNKQKNKTSISTAGG